MIISMHTNERWYNMTRVGFETECNDLLSRVLLPLKSVFEKAELDPINVHSTKL